MPFACAPLPCCPGPPSRCVPCLHVRGAAARVSGRAPAAAGLHEQQRGVPAVPAARRPPCRVLRQRAVGRAGMHEQQRGSSARRRRAGHWAGFCVRRRSGLLAGSGSGSGSRSGAGRRQVLHAGAALVRVCRAGGGRCVHAHAAGARKAPQHGHRQLHPRAPPPRRPACPRRALRARARGGPSLARPALWHIDRAWCGPARLAGLRRRMSVIL